MLWPMLAIPPRFGQAASPAHGERHSAYRDPEADRAPEKSKKIAAAVYRYLADNNGEWVARIALTMKLARQRSFVLRSGTR